MGWLAKKAQNARVYMCLKEVAWDLEARSQEKRAVILAMTQLARTGFEDGAGFPSGIFDNPLMYSRDELMVLYEGLEEVRNSATAQRESLSNSMTRIGLPLPTYAIDHMKDSNRGLEVLMCTLAAGITPDRRDEVRAIWDTLLGATHYLPTAIAHLRSIEARTAVDTGGPVQPIFEITDTEWLNACQFVPGIFTTSL